MDRCGLRVCVMKEAEMKGRQEDKPYRRGKLVYAQTTPIVG